jgi:bacillopeptidase F
MRRSRLSKNAEKKTRKTLFLSVVGIIIVVFLLAKFGIGLLVNFSLFLAGPKDNQLLQGNSQINFVAPPTLNPLPNATNSAKIIISGRSTKEIDIELFINDDLIDETKTDKDGGFVFTPNLKEGNNQIKTRAIYKDKKSDFSVTFEVILKNSQPTLEVTSPSDGQTFKKDQNNVTIQGKTDLGVTITVNVFWAVIDDSNNFSYNLPLQNGDNEIKIVAIDQAGNRSEKSLKVNYSQ